MAHTWQRRGFASKNGVATVLSVNPDGHAKVIDVDVASNHGDACAKSHKKLDDEQFAVWYVQHKGDCSKHHEGSAGQMELKGIVCSEGLKSSTSSNTVGVLGMATQRVTRVLLMPTCQSNIVGLPPR